MSREIALDTLEMRQLKSRNRPALRPLNAVSQRSSTIIELSSRPGNLIMFPIGATGEHKEAVMPERGDDAGYCRNGLSTRNYRGATPEDRAIYRKWILGMVVFYSALLLVSGAVAIVVEASPGLTRLTSLSAHTTTVSPDRTR
jgi:hypothetical protein